MNPNFEPIPCYTGIVPPNLKSDFTETHKNKWELVEQYYVTPLKEMKGHEAFICLMACFALYEKLLRRTLNLREDDKFSQGHPVFKTVGKEWGISAEQAFQIWHHWRNGLLHRAMPKLSGTFTSWLTSKGAEAISVSPEGHVTINPWLFRDRLMILMEQNKSIWNDADFPLLKEVRYL